MIIDRRRVVVAGLTGGLVIIGLGLARTIRRPVARHQRQNESRWHVTTVEAAPTVIAPDGRPPEPVTRLGDAVDVRLEPTVGGATELGLRLRGTGRAADGAGEKLSVADLRSALRQSKQLIEVGEVLRVDPQPHGHRSSTPGGKLIAALTRRAAGGGVA